MHRIDLRDASGSCRASVLPSFGFNLFRLTVSGHEVLWSHSEVENGSARPSGSGIPILFPFPGRLPGKTFCWNSQNYTLHSDDGLGHAIHGLVLDRPWRVVDQRPDEVTGEFQLSLDAPELIDQWPSDFLIRCRYRLHPTGLKGGFYVENVGNEELPCGLGTHAYFSIPTSDEAAKNCLIKFSAKSHWQLDNMLTVGETAELQVNQWYESFRVGRPLDGLQLDDVFSNTEFLDGQASASIIDQDCSRTITLAWDEHCDTCVVYIPQHREAICIEPCSLVPGGFGFTGTDDGLQVLAPGQSFEHRLLIEVEN